MNKATETLYVKSRDEWRSWLEKNHQSEKEVWLLYYKKHTNKPRIGYDEAVEEALCFGWIDSVVRRIDEDSYCQRFTPRRSGSGWAPSNVIRVKHLIESGRMTEPGLALFNETISDPSLLLKPAPKAESVLPPSDLVKALKENKRAYNHFMGFTPSYRSMTIRWITSAKRSETRERRVAEVVDMSSRGEKIGLK
jgi:uncharacterized protein YdeI (YjbR/CyaY-like superfamily)